MLSAAGMPLGHIALVHEDGERAEILARLLRNAGHRVTVVPTGPGQRWTFAVAQLTRVIIPIYQGVVAEIGLEATEPLARRERRRPGLRRVGA